MDITTYLVGVFCLVDDFLKDKRLRQRGPQPTLSDSEVLTMEIVGEFLGIDTDSGIFRHFRRYYGDWFPALRRIDRTTVVRQAANRWAVKQALWVRLISKIEHDPLIAITDSLPIPVCRLARAYRCRILAGDTAFGKDEVARQTYLGLRLHVRLNLPAVITDFRLAPANVHDLAVAEDLFAGSQGWVLGDRNYWSPDLKKKGWEQGLIWLTPYTSAKREKKPWPRWLSHKRYLIDTVFSQLTERFHAKRVSARDAWHFFSRWLRKILSHTVAVFFCQQLGLPPLHFAKLFID
ncbi:MAG: IS982 family transposase [Chloroflexota bacterium]